MAKYVRKNTVPMNISLSIQDRAEDGTITPMDITGFTAKSSLRNKRIGVFDLTTTVDETLNRIHVSLTKEQIAAIPLGEYDWDVILIAPDGEEDAFPKDSNAIIEIIQGASTNDN